MLSKTSTYVKSYDGETKWMNFLIKDAELFKKYTDIWMEISKSIEKELDLHLKKFKNQIEVVW